MAARHTILKGKVLRGKCHGDAKKKRFTFQDLRNMWTTIYLAKKMGKSMG